MVMLCPIHRLTANCGNVIAHSFSQDERSVCHNRAHGSTHGVHAPRHPFAVMRRTLQSNPPPWPSHRDVNAVYFEPARSRERIHPRE